MTLKVLPFQTQKHPETKSHIFHYLTVSVAEGMHKMWKSRKGIWDKWAELNSRCINLSPVITNKPPIIQPISGCFILDMRYSFCLTSENSININEAQSPSGTYTFVCCLLYLLPHQVWNGYPPLPEFRSAWALPEVKCLCLQDCRRARGSYASLTASMSTQPGARDGETSPVMERHSHPSHKTLAGLHKPPACLGLSSLYPVSQATAATRQR